MKKKIPWIWALVTVLPASLLAIDDEVPVFPPSEEEYKLMVEREKLQCEQEKAEGKEVSQRCKEAEAQQQAGEVGQQTERAPARDDSWKANSRADY